jgi:hypothetical protein
LRHSCELRSLKFFHGLPQVSSRTRDRSVIPLPLRLVQRTKRAGARPQEHGTYAYFNWVLEAFYRNAKQGLYARWPRTIGASGDEKTLLTSAAGLIRQFRFG